MDQQCNRYFNPRQDYDLAGVHIRILPVEGSPIEVGTSAHGLANARVPMPAAGQVLTVELTDPSELSDRGLQMCDNSPPRWHLTEADFNPMRYAYVEFRARR